MSPDDALYEKVTKKILTETLRMKKGETLTIATWDNGLPFARRLIVEVRRIGAIPVMLLEDESAYLEGVRVTPKDVLGSMGKHEHGLRAPTRTFSSRGHRQGRCGRGDIREAAPLNDGARSASAIPPALYQGESFTVSALICFDLNFNFLVSPVAKAGGVLAIPFERLKGIEGLHTPSVVRPAVMVGVPLVRSTTHGISAVFDAAGRLLAKGSSFDGPVVLVTEMPIEKRFIPGNPEPPQISARSGSELTPSARHSG